jgi:hypothetical protein
MRVDSDILIADHVGMTEEKMLPGGRLSSGQAAHMLSCSISHVRKISKDELPYIKVGTHRRYLPKDVINYMEKEQAPA